MTSLAPYLLSVLRIVAAFNFITHGTQKLFAMPVNQPRETAEMLTRAWVAGTLEAVGGTLLLFGLFTRPVAFVLAGEMAVAYFQAHAPRGIWPILNGGEITMLFCFVWLYICVAGPGPLSVDTLIRRKK